MLGPSSPPPHSLAVHTLPFRALASLAGRSPLGSEREVAMGCFVAARLAAGVIGPDALPREARAQRAVAARTWFAGLALPAVMRAPFAKLVDATADDDPVVLSRAFGGMLQATASFLDAPARRELEDLARQIG